MVNPSIMGHSGANLMNTFQRNYFGLDAAKQASFHLKAICMIVMSLAKEVIFSHHSH